MRRGDDAVDGGLLCCALRPTVKAIMVVVVASTVLWRNLPLPVRILILILVCLGLYSVRRIPTVQDVTEYASLHPPDGEIIVLEQPVASLA